MKLEDGVLSVRTCAVITAKIPTATNTMVIANMDALMGIPAPIVPPPVCQVAKHAYTKVYVLIVKTTVIVRIRTTCVNVPRKIVLYMLMMAFVFSA